MHVYASIAHPPTHTHWWEFMKYMFLPFASIALKNMHPLHTGVFKKFRFIVEQMSNDNMILT